MRLTDHRFELGQSFAMRPLLAGCAVFASGMACSNPLISAPSTPSEDQVETAIAIIMSLTAVEEAILTEAAVTPSVTPSITPQPTATMRATVTPIPGSVVYRDNFSGSTSNWGLFDNQNVTIQQDDGVLSIRVKVPDASYWTNLGGDFDDVIIEVDVQLISGSLDADYGVMCRLADRKGYQFWVSGDGYYAVFRWEDGNYIPLDDWSKSPSINTGRNVVNHISAGCLEGELHFSVNGDRLVTVFDQSLDKGYVALMVSAYDVLGAIVHFDNLVLRDPSE